VLIVVSSVAVNCYRNNPQRIFAKIQDQVTATDRQEFNSFQDWLWKTDRAFVFDVIYMNMSSTGTTTMKVVEQTPFDGNQAYVLEAVMQPNQFIKSAYDAKMSIRSIVSQKEKASLFYQEKTTTPEKTKIKEIVFNPAQEIAERDGIKFKIPALTFDPLSVFFAFLDREFTIGKPIVLNLLSKEEIYEFSIEPIELASDIFTLKGEVRRKDRSSAHGAKFTIWVLNQKTKVPLLAKISSAAGPIYIRLVAVR